MNRFVLVVAMTFAMAQGMSSQSLPPPSQAWGPSADGLRIGISAISTTVPSLGPQFMIALQNIGNTDFVVNLGFMLGNGKVMFPVAIRLSLTDPAGDTRELQFFDRRYPAIVGRLDDFTVSSQVVCRSSCWVDPSSTRPASLEVLISTSPGNRTRLSSADAVGRRQLIRISQISSLRSRSSLA
jgi:hypothetical protein